MLFEAEFILDYSVANHKNHTGKLIDGVQGSKLRAGETDCPFKPDGIQRPP